MRHWGRGFASLGLRVPWKQIVRMFLTDHIG